MVTVLFILVTCQDILGDSFQPAVQVQFGLVDLPDYGAASLPELQLLARGEM